MNIVPPQNHVKLRGKAIICVHSGTSRIRPDKLILVPARMCMQFIVLFMLLLVNLAVLYSMDSCFSLARINICYLVLGALTLAIQ